MSLTARPKQREPACLALPGAGTLLLCLSGALEVLSERVVFTHVGGTSGGGLVALALAKGLSPSQISSLLSDLLQRKDLLDKGWPFDSSPGIYKGDRIAGFMRDVFGDDLCMGGLHTPARVCVVDTWTRKPAVIDSREHPEVPVWRAARATMAIEFFFDLVRLREDNARLYGDGGLILNVPHGLWDDVPDLPTVSLRFRHQQRSFSVAELIENGRGNANPSRVKQVRSWSDLVPAVAGTCLDAASASWPSNKGPDLHEVVISTEHDGMKFGLSGAECQQRVMNGRQSARRFLQGLA